MQMLAKSEHIETFFQGCQGMEKGFKALPQQQELVAFLGAFLQPPVGNFKLIGKKVSPAHTR